jgi:hypothetical protein
MSPADWIVQAQIPWEQLVHLGPPDFPAYARLPSIPDPAKPGQTEADIDLADDHPSDMQQPDRPDTLLDAPELDVVPAQPTQSQPTYY